MKDLTRNNQMIKEKEIITFIESLPISKKIKSELMKIKPGN